MKSKTTFLSHLNIKHIAIFLLSLSGSFVKEALSLNMKQTSLVMNDFNSGEISTENGLKWTVNSNDKDSADDMNCGVRYLGFSAADRQVDSNQYTIGLCVPDSCSTIFSSTSASGQELFDQALNLTQQIQMGKYGGIYQDPGQYSYVVTRLILITDAEPGAAWGISVERPIGYALKFISIFPYTETSFSRSILDDFNSMANRYQDAFQECKRKSTGANMGIIMGIGFFTFLGVTAYKCRSHIADCFRDCSSRLLGPRPRRRHSDAVDGVQLLSPGSSPGSAAYQPT